jgi:hypothetical protein
MQSTETVTNNPSTLRLHYFKGKLKKAKTSFGKHVCRKAPGVRIPSSPPVFKGKAAFHDAAFFQ